MPLAYAFVAALIVAAGATVYSSTEQAKQTKEAHKMSETAWIQAEKEKQEAEALAEKEAGLASQASMLKKKKRLAGEAEPVRSDIHTSQLGMVSGTQSTKTLLGS